MCGWANRSSPFSASPDSDAPHHIRIMIGGSGAGVGDEQK
jgi:hypothetical protein